MRRFISISALVTALLVSLSLQAQMRGGGGGHGFSGGARGFSAPRGSSGFRSSAPGGGRAFSSGPRVFAPSGPRVFSPGGTRVFTPSARPFAPRTFSPTSSRFGGRTFASGRRGFAPFPGRSFGFRRFHDRFFFRNRFFFPGCFGCVSPFLFNGGLFFDPFYPSYYSGFGPDSYGYGQQASQPVIVNSDNGNSAQLTAEVERLSDEVDDLRYEESRNRVEARSASDPKASISVMEPVTAVNFIFRDGRRISARNYAIAGQTLWILDEHAAKKFALADVDTDATEKANAVNGVEIHFPRQ